MPLRFFRRIRIIPGLRLNLNGAGRASRELMEIDRC